MENQWGVTTFTGLRVQVRHDRIRVPDIVVIENVTPQSAILTMPPLLCLEICSRHDATAEMQARLEDYRAFGVRNIWLVHERMRRAFIYDSDGMREGRDGILTTTNPNIRVVLSEPG